jgi:DNA-directed RNA polymerase subunit RPC12/RpoP
LHRRKKQEGKTNENFKIDNGTDLDCRRVLCDWDGGRDLGRHSTFGVLTMNYYCETCGSVVDAKRDEEMDELACEDCGEEVRKIPEHDDCDMER